ncbi:unnamed protein product [Moneuplotes crassus]|uniref:Uncharacterized protein n=1 Tax=Euplotes crassus TaxID=5936 RepID=A0AAD1URC8_EUPCR|nr:unnamed protein product [Moneuplotes crassus]
MKGERIDTWSSVEENQNKSDKISQESASPHVVITKKTRRIKEKCLARASKGTEKDLSISISPPNLNEDIKILESMKLQNKDIINTSTQENPFSKNRPPSCRFPFRNMMLSKENLQIRKNCDIQIHHKKQRPKTARFRRKVPNSKKYCSLRPRVKKMTGEFEKYLMKIKKRKKSKENKIQPIKDTTQTNGLNKELTWVNISSKGRNTILPFAFDKKIKIAARRPQTAIRRGSCETVYKERVNRVCKLKTLSAHNTTKDISKRLKDFYISTRIKPCSLKKRNKRKDLMNIQRNYTVSKTPLAHLHPRLKQAMKKNKLRKIFS